VALGKIAHGIRRYRHDVYTYTFSVPKARDDNRDFRPICPRFRGAEPAKM